MTPKKPRGDSKLKTLPEDRQAEIIAYINGHTFVDAVKWLRDDGIQTSYTAVRSFWSWFKLQEQFHEDETTTEGLIEQLKAKVPALSEAELDELGQRTFSLLSIRRQDLDGFVKMRSARFKGEIEKAKLHLREAAEKRLQESLGLQRQKFQRETAEYFVKWYEDNRAKEIVASSTSNTEKIEKLGELMFGEDWK